MKLLLILVATYGLVVCQVQAYPGLSPPDIMHYPRPRPPNFKPRPHIVDMIITKIQEMIHDFVTGLHQLKKPLVDNGFSNLVTLLDSITDALIRFSDSIGPAKISADILPTMCRLYDSRPECRRGYGIY